MSTWVGLDGWQPLGSNDILQIGVYQNIDTHGNTSTWAWYEWWLANPPASAPAYVDAVPINWNSFPVNPGYTLTATAAYSSGAGIVSLWNETSGKVFRKVLAPPPGADFNGRSAEASECYEDGRNDRACEHPAPGLSSGRTERTKKPTAVPASAPTARKANAPSTSLPRLELGMFSEMIMCAVE
jgi:hypothetical protein